MKVIVQYKQVPTAAHYATMQGRGGRLHAKLHMIKGAAFTIPVSALAALEADPEIVSVTHRPSHEGMDDLTNDCHRRARGLERRLQRSGRWRGRD